MTIPISGAGSLFVRLGHNFAILLDVNAARGSSVTAPDYTVLIPTKVNSNVLPDYAAGTANYALVNGTTTTRGVQGVNALQSLATWQTAQTQILNDLKRLATATIIDMAAIDVPATPLTINAAMALLCAQIKGVRYVAGSTVAAGAQTNGTPTPNGAYAATGNSGPIIVTSIKDGHGFNQDNTLAETVTFATTLDSQTGGATIYGETITATGAVDASGGDMLSPYWPSGSGRSLTLTAVNAALNNSGGNLLQNSEFVTFTTANQADNWTYATGSAGTAAGNIGKSVTGYLDSSSLCFFGDGATLHSVTQSFNTTPTTTVGAGGTSANLLSLTARPFAVNFWIKCSAVPATGVLQINLTDSAGTIINDDAGTANTVTVDLTAGGINTTSWYNVQCTFRLPTVDTTVLPLKLRIWASTAIANTKNLLIDRVGMAQMQQFYSVGSTSTATGGSVSNASATGGGPWFAVFSGNLTTVLNDSWTIALTNTWGAYVQHFQRLFNMTQLGQRLNTDSVTGTPTVINVNLIV